MRIQVDFVSESSNVVFHATQLDNLYHILKNDELELTSVLGADADDISQDASRLYYLSTTRHRLGGYHLGSIDRGGILLRLNSTKLGSNLKSAPVDYWQNYATEDMRSRYHEAEERFVSNKPTISRVKRCIEDVTLYFPNGIIEEKRSRVVLRHVISLCKKAKIPIRVYFDKSAFLSDDKSKRKPLRDFFESGRLTSKKFRLVQSSEQVSKYVELIYKESVSDLGKEAQQLYFDYLRYGMRELGQFARTFDSDLGYARNVPRQEDADSRKAIDTITRYMQTHRWKSKDLVKFLLNKWSSL